MAVVEGGVELIDADAGGCQIGVVTADAVLFEEGLYLLFKRRLKGGGLLGDEVAGGPGDSDY